jgi:hypothetical protein
MRLAGSRIV